MPSKWSVVFALVAVLQPSVAMESAKIYMKRADFGDQAASESGYVFEANSGEPGAYSGYGSSTGSGAFEFKQLPMGRGLYDTGAQQFPSNWPFGQGQYVSQDLPYVPYAYGGPAGYSGYYVPTYYNQPGTTGGDYLLNKYGAVQFPNNDDVPAHSSGDGFSSSQGDNFLKETGQKHGSSNHASHGEKGDSGYKKVDSFEKGSQGEHDNEDHKGFYAQTGGNKKSQQDSGEHYGKKEEAAKGNKGESYSQSKSHKKGSKTTGYHKVYHKDEYKKDHSFYDEADSKGHYDKHDNYNANHASASGASEKGAKSESGHHQHEKGAKGSTDKGHHVDNSSGFKGSQGQQSYHNDQEEYDKTSSQEAKQANGYSENKGDKFAH